MSLLSPSRLLALAVLAPVVVCLCLVPVRESVSNTAIVLFLVLVIAALAAGGGSRLVGICSALTSAVAFDFLLTVPYQRLAMTDPDDVETAVLLTLVGIAITEIALWGRRQQAAASRREGYLGGVVAAAGLVAADDVPHQAALTIIATQVREVLGIDACTYAPGPLSARPRLNRDGSVTRDGRPLDVDRSGLPSDDVVELPLESRGVVLGKYLLTATAAVRWTTLEQRLVAVTLADQAAAVLVTSPRT